MCQEHHLGDFSAFLDVYQHEVVDLVISLPSLGGELQFLLKKCCKTDIFWSLRKSSFLWELFPSSQSVDLTTNCGCLCSLARTRQTWTEKVWNTHANQSDFSPSFCSSHLTRESLEVLGIFNCSSDSPHNPRAEHLVLRARSWLLISDWGPMRTRLCSERQVSERSPEPTHPGAPWTAPSGLPSRRIFKNTQGIFVKFYHMGFILMVGRVTAFWTTRGEENKTAGVSWSAIWAPHLPGVPVAVFGFTADTITFRSITQGSFSVGISHWHPELAKLLAVLDSWRRNSLILSS